MSEDEQVEMEAVTIQVPKVMMRFLRAMSKHIDTTPKEWLEVAVVAIFGADLETEDIFIPKTKHLVKEYNLAVLNKIHPNTIEAYFLDC